MKQLKAGRTELNVVDDKDGTPTYTRDFARNVKLLLEQELWGLYNMVCGGQTSRFEVAQELLGLLGLTEKVQLHPVPSSYFEGEYFAPRPPSERLINRKLDLRGINVMRDWKVALKDYLSEHYAGYMA
jgi:dTDP-4-dehydrorhamnose reductase